MTDLLASGEEVVVVDNLFATDAAAIERLAAHPRCHFVSGSFGNPRVLAAAFACSPISTVYCLAAQASAHPKAAAPRYTESSNLLAPRLLLEAMRRANVRSIVYASSLRVYGDTTGPDTGEDAPYGAFRDLAHLSKCYVEKLLEMYAERHGMRCIAARLGIVYGLSPVMKTDYRFMTAPNKFCLQLVRGETPALYPGSGDIAGFIHAADSSAALRTIATEAGFACYTPVNVATEWTTVATVAAIAGEVARDRGLAATGPASAVETVRSVGPRLASTGFVARHELRAGLSEMLEYFAAMEREGGARLGRVAR